MNNDQEFYSNVQMPIDSAERRHAPKALRNGIIFFVAVIAVGAVAYLIFSPKPQHTDNEEPMYSYAREGSRIIDLEAVMDYAGATDSEYNLLVEKLDKYFDTEYPDEKYFSLVGDTLKFEDVEITVPNATAADASGAANDDEIDSGPYNDEEIRSLDIESSPKKITFELESSSSKRFSVEMAPNLSSTKTTIKIEAKEGE